jgi:hypothetical protein
VTVNPVTGKKTMTVKKWGQRQKRASMRRAMHQAKPRGKPERKHGEEEEGGHDKRPPVEQQRG